MALAVAKTVVWAACIEDRAGGLAEKLTVLAEAGAQLEFLIARREPDKPGTGVVFVTPLTGATQLRAAKKAGFAKTDSLHSVRIEGPDKPRTLLPNHLRPWLKPASTSADSRQRPSARTASCTWPSIRRPTPRKPSVC